MNRTVLWVFFVLLVGASVSWIAYENKPRDSAPTGGGTIAFADNLTASIALRASEDSDNDGLYDWEEELWGTDPQNKDSDGDGTEDGDEVANDRHPGKPAPNDVLTKGSSVTLQESINAYLTDENRTETEKIALKLFQGYSELRKEDGLGGADEEALLKGLISGQFANKAPRYHINELATVADSESARAEYKRAFDAVTTLFSDVTENELLTLERALESEQEADIAKLDIAISVYTDATRRLLIMPVPKGIAVQHLDLLNNIVRFRDGVSDMRTSLDDPIRGSAGVQTYLEGVNALTLSFRNINGYFEMHGLNKNAS
ncbi:MAG TPA: hypothetical protein VGA06_02855 [Candidatus Paceibacterota bacterium]